MGPREPTESAAAIVDDEALAWRDALSLRLIRGMLATFAALLPVLWFSLEGSRARYTLLAVDLVGCLVFAIPAFAGWPNGRSRGWIIVAPALLVSLAGFAQLGFLAGSGVCLTITLMLAGVLLGRRVMIVLVVVSALVVASIAWGMVQGSIAPPDPRDVSMTHALPWLRSLGVTFFGITLFGVLLVAILDRIEHALRLARSETQRREQAERARAEAEILALEAKQLEAIGRLAAGIAHDFNNNLTAIIGCAELLKMELSEQSSSREFADGILQSSQRAAELTRQLLVYSRKAQMQQIPNDLHRIVEEAVSFLRRSIDPKVEVQAELTAKNPKVTADAALLQSAVLNLLVNAHDAMPNGGKLSISTTNVELSADPTRAGPVGPCVLLEVLDTGVGIPSELLPQIFDPFFTTKPVGKGTGLGLAAVAGTIRGHGGRIEVESEIGLGTAFRVFLPSLIAEGDTNQPVSSDIVRGDGEILLVEDDAMVSFAAVGTLKSMGYRVTRVSSGQAALDAVRASPSRFQLVLLDLRMPGMSGVATFDALSGLAPRLPVLIWSGHNAEQDVRALLHRGAVGFVQKPYRVSELSRTIADAMLARRSVPSLSRVEAAHRA
jgi:signal transduction histidine kinase/ActR/RegA family two-component response regulator